MEIEMEDISLAGLPNLRKKMRTPENFKPGSIIKIRYQQTSPEIIILRLGFKNESSKSESSDFGREWAVACVTTNPPHPEDTVAESILTLIHGFNLHHIVPQDESSGTFQIFNLTLEILSLDPSVIDDLETRLRVRSEIFFYPSLLSRLLDEIN